MNPIESMLASILKIIYVGIFVLVIGYLFVGGGEWGERYTTVASAVTHAREEVKGYAWSATKQIRMALIRTVLTTGLSEYRTGHTPALFVSCAEIAQNSLTTSNMNTRWPTVRGRKPQAPWS